MHHATLLPGLAAATLVTAATATTPATSIDAIFAAAHDRDAFHGNVLAAAGDTVLYEASFGRADDSTGTPLDATSVFELASITKPITAVAVLQLVEANEVELDAPVSAHLDELPVRGITIRHLLTHTSGLLSHQQLFMRYGRSLPPGAVVDNDAILEFLRRERPEPASAPGERFDYNNLNYILLAAIVEQVAGISFDDYLEERIFEPAGMGTADLLLDRYADSPTPVPNLTRSYVRSLEGTDWVEIEEADPRRWGFVKTFSATAGDAGIVATARDLLAFDRALRDGTLLRPDTLKLAYTSGTLSDGTPIENVGWMPSGYGLGWYLTGDGLAWHSGDWGGYQTVIFRDLARDRVLIVLQNRAANDWSWVGPVFSTFTAPAN